MCFSNSKDSIYFYDQKNIFYNQKYIIFKIKDKKLPGLLKLNSL